MIRRLVTTTFGLLQTTRLPTAFFVGMAVFLPSRFVGVDGLASFLSSMPFSLAAMGGFALNDYYDADRDRINNPHRAIPSRTLTAPTALAAAIVLLAAALVGAGIQSAGEAELCLYVAAIVGAWAYNIVVRRFALFKTVYTAALCSMPVLYDIVVLRYSGVYYPFPAATLLFVVGRELLMDIRDVAGDRSSGITTVPMILGRDVTAKAAFLLQLFGTSLLLPAAVTVSRPWNGVLLTLMLASIGVAMVAWWSDSARYQRRIIQLLWIPMLTGVAMLLTEPWSGR